MPPVCPTCNTPLDPAHAPIARVRGARVVTYCSSSCATNAVAGGAKVSPDTEETVADALDLAKFESPPVESASEEAEEAPPAAHESADAEAELVRAARSGWLSGSRRRRVLWASAAIMVGGMAVAIIPVISPTASSSVSAADSTPSVRGLLEDSKRTTPPPEVVVPAPAKLGDKELRAAAIAELEKALVDGSARDQRLAGIALARLSHPRAASVLGRLLKSETSDLSRVDIAYGMALGGADAGRSYLVGQLKSKRRDVRIDAARRLVQLGDDAGRATLVQMLSIRSHRLGASMVLAQLGDERGIAVLRETLGDVNSSHENKMRSAVGLGRSGDSSTREYLESILKEGKYVVDAAGALAALGETSATPALLRQLELTSMRVQAAESLKKIGQKVDLAPMAAALEAGSTDGRIAVAEAILILTDEEVD